MYFEQDLIHLQVQKPLKLMLVFSPEQFELKLCEHVFIVFLCLTRVWTEFCF